MLVFLNENDDHRTAPQTIIEETDSELELEVESATEIEILSDNSQ